MAESHRRMFEIRAFHNARKERLFYQGKRMVWVFETWRRKKLKFWDELYQSKLKSAQMNKLEKEMNELWIPETTHFAV